MLAKLFRQIFQRRFVMVIILLLVIAGGYFGYQTFAKNKNIMRYVTAVVEKGTLTVSVSGSGQVSVSDQIDIKPKVSGDIVYVNVKNGQEVKNGDLLVQIDDRNAQKAVRDSEIVLETAKLELEKLLKPPDKLTLLQAENALIQAKDNFNKLKFTQESDYQKALESKQKSEDDLKKAYEDGFNIVANTFLDIPTVMAGLQDILFSKNLSLSQQQWNLDYYTDSVKTYDERVFQYKEDAENKYQKARTDYDQNFQNYKLSSRFSEKGTIESLIDETYETTKNIAEAVKNTNNLIQFYQDRLIEREMQPSVISYTHLSSLNSYTGKTNNHLLNLLSIKRTIRSNKETIFEVERSLKEMDQNHPLNLAAAERIVREKEESLAKLKAGPDDLDIRIKKIAIQQKENALSTAKQTLTDHYIHAPFNGIVIKMNVKKRDSVSPNTILFTLIAQQKIAEISLNEIDVTKVKVGQKATLTFDALSGVTISGKVIEIDTTGTVSQGVVSYGVKIVLDTEDKRIKPGMSVTADIITDVKQGVLILPNSAIKLEGNSHYVELVEMSEETKQQLLANRLEIILPKPPKRQLVEIGLSNDLSTEIISGLKENDIVIISTIDPTRGRTTQTQRNQQFQIPGMGGPMRMR